MTQDQERSSTEPPPSTRITDVAALEVYLGEPSVGARLKVIDHVDEGAAHWIAVSPLAFLAFGAGSAHGASAEPVAISLAGGTPGEVAARVDPGRVRMALNAIDDPGLATVGAPISTLFLVPGVGETLRVNGRVAEMDARSLVIDVDECYVHCAKALIRSSFWQAAPRVDAPDTLAGFVPESAFFALASFDGGTGADISPKGDPAGSMIRLAGDRLTYAERPGNRRADGLRNILAQPRVAALALIPGTDRVAVMTGEASIVTDEAQRAEWTVAGKAPVLVTSIALRAAAVRRSAALARAELWPVRPPADLPSGARMLVNHITINRDRSEAAEQLRAALAVPGTMEKNLADGYRTRLY